MLGRELTKERAPLWLEKWAALVLEFIEEERRLLPDQLCSLQLPYASYTRSAAEVEAKGAVLAQAPTAHRVESLFAFPNFVRQACVP